MPMSPDRLDDLARLARSLVEELPTASENPKSFTQKVASLCLVGLDGNHHLSQDLKDAVPIERFAELQRALDSLRTQATSSYNETLAEPILRNLNTVAQILEQTSNTKRDSATPIAQRSDAENLYGQWIRGEQIGFGGQGAAYLATNPQTGQLGALKVLHRDKTGDLSEKAFGRFRHELQALQKIEHPCILKVLDFDLEAEVPWVVTEYLALGSLDKVLKATAGDAWRTLRLARDIATALAAAHAKKIIHRDVKPKNILLRTLDHAVLGDFGIAHISGTTQLTSTDEKVRAHWFGPPEAETGKIENPAPSFDVYSLGKVIYVCLSGGIQFQREKFRGGEANLVSQLQRPELEFVNRLLDRMIVEDPAGRFQKMEEVIARIDETLGELFGCGPPDQCRVCRSGRYRTAQSGEFLVDNRLHLVVYEDREGGRPPEGGTPAVDICSTCGDIRLSAPRKRKLWLSAQQ
jgi:serine/threonine protein kinase